MTRLAPSDAEQDAHALALAAYRDISAGRKPSVDLKRLPDAAVIAAALEHGAELHASGRIRGYRGFAREIAAATAHKARFGLEEDR